ncbi:MAG: lipopolysaccharide heptosyltransferase II [Candidatus Zixiibacteriota bacterium]
MTDPSAIHSVIVRLPNWIGDAVMAIPAVNCIKQHLPHAEVTCLGKKAVNQLYRYNHNVDQLLEFKLPEGKNRLSALKSFSQNLRKHSFDLGLILPDSFSSALVFRLGDVRRRVGYRSELRSFMLTDSIRLPADLIHRSEKYIGLVMQAFGIENCCKDIAVDVSDRERQAADRFLTVVGKFVVICPTSRAPSRRWGEEKYCELIARVHNDLRLSVVLAGSGDESELIEQIGNKAGVPYLNLAQEDDLLLSVEVMRRAEAFVGNDSGAAHLAASAGARVVSISGADDPRETRPLARVGTIVNKQIHCSPCVKNTCPRDDQVNECMDVIAVGEVVEVVREIMAIEK